MRRLADDFEGAVGEIIHTVSAASTELVESARVDARAVGYAQGWAQGLREAAAGQAAEVEQARA